MPRLAKVTDDLSPTAQLILTRGFAAKKPAAAIVAEVQEATGEEVSERTVSRRAAEWRDALELRRQSRERIHDLVAETKDQGLDPAGIIQAMAREFLENNPEALTSSDPVKFAQLALNSGELELKKRQMSLRENKHGLDERRLKLAEDREKRAIAILEAKQGDKSVSPEEQITRIKEIYGLS